MLAVSDTSPINYLLQIDEIEILRKLYGRVILPDSVIAELVNKESPALVRHWAALTPEWVQVRMPARESGRKPMHLGPGERDAIVLAQEIRADVLIIDERAGVTEAENRGLLVTGTLGVLEKAATLGLVNLPQCVSRLLKTNFRIRLDFVENFLKRHKPQ